VETRANYVLVGSSVLAALAIITIFVFWLGSRQLNHRDEIYHTYFTGSVAGLAAGSPVRYRGVPVGTVGGIEIDPQNIERIRVTLKMRPHTPVRIDTVASLETAGITGGSYIELSGGTQGSPPLTGTEEDDIPVIKSENSSLQSLVADAPKLLGKLNQLADSANAALSPENVKALSATFAHIQNVSASLDAIGPDAKQAVANFNQISVDLHKQMPQIVDTLHQDGTSIKEAADGFHKVATDLDAMIVENRGPLRDFTGNGLSEVGALLSNLRALTDTLNRVADRLDRDPRRYLFGGTNSGVDTTRPLSSGVPTGARR
jgi:phospholipid/cholesterol/gamma-HCH transport system substrate-binding protein